MFGNLILRLRKVGARLGQGLDIKQGLGRQGWGKVGARSWARSGQGWGKVWARDSDNGID